jgi:DNA-binding MarR family transcriptional regulator
MPATALQVLRQFRVVFNAVKSHFQQIEKKTGIGGSQVWALSIVAQQPGIGMSALKQAMDIHQSTASNLVKALVQRELLRVEKDDKDGRAVRLFPTPAGKKLLKSTPPPWAGVLPGALAQMDDASLRRMEIDLGKLLQLLGQDPNAKAARTPLADL